MSASLTLYDLPHSPYCLPIKRILQAYEVPFEIVDVPNWDRRAVIEASGGQYYQVPMLVHEGRAIYESSAESNDVARYVDKTFAGSTLFPGTLAGLHDILIAYLDDEVEGATFRCTDVFYVPSIEDPVGRMMTLRHKERKFGRGCIDQWRASLAELRAGSAKHFARFDAMLQHQPFLLGSSPVFADFLLYGILTNYTWKGWNELPPDMPTLRLWLERMRGWRA
ncbi:glutathione S-transferase [Roseimicrobium gellanilyticum]|uniref:Glutathione S-transferase n=1 Tax=Roseimicrobium gellanilyticum TaxID=748857 RepID=A0A366HI51_9BACT|nr:glutathione S-transferase family protein [Roseimicrobium gellanilyticum]RBP42448.1 glutathione S-transferase [Roseimicrobium gellanilyticum]